MEAEKAKVEAVVARIKPVLDCIDLDVVESSEPQPGLRPPRLDAIIEKCRGAWESFKNFNRDAILSVATHVLAVV